MSQSPFSEAISKLKPKEKEPRSARVLDGWVAQAQQAIGGPCAVDAHEHWRADFATARVGSYVHVTLEDAVAAVNTWINQIAAAT